MDNLRLLIAEPDEKNREVLVEGIKKCVAGCDFSFAKDGSEVIFKLSNAQHHVVLMIDQLPKRNAYQLTEWILNEKRQDSTAIIILGEAPENETFVDQVVTGRVQFLKAQPLNQINLEKAVARALNFVSHGDKSEFHLRFLATGEPLMREGEKADNVYLLRKGRLRAQRTVESQNHLLGYIEIGEFVGEMAYINGEPRSADVMAEGPCELIEIPVECLDHVLFQKPAWSKALMRTLSKRLKSANNSLSRAPQK